MTETIAIPEGHEAPETDQEKTTQTSRTPGSEALDVARRNVDIVHTSLAGMTAIVVVLLFAVALPVFGHPPVSQLAAFITMAVAAVAGIGTLYYMNFRIHEHVSTQARLTEVLVNSLGQGFLSFNADGHCASVYSQACIELLENIPAGKNIMNVLGIPTDQHADVKEWLGILFMSGHALGFDDVVRFLPQTFPHSRGRRVTLMYRPIRDQAGMLTQVVVIATDQTEEYEAEMRAQQQQDYVDMICLVFKERNQFLATVTHIRKFIEVAAEPLQKDYVAAILRSLHTLKAAAKHFHLTKLNETIRTIESDLRAPQISEENFLKRLKSGREEVSQELNNVMEELRNFTGQDYEGHVTLHEVDENLIYDFARAMRKQNAPRELVRSYLTSIASVQVHDCFKAFERELCDLSEITGKQIKPIRYTGSNPPVLTRPIQEFLFSLSHICRNIIDHGIEPAVTRLARGKDPAGQVSIHGDLVFDEDSKREWLHLIVADDGGGIDPSRVRAKLTTMDPRGAWREEDDQTVIQRIFSWGFSTRDQITDLSGRGVGLEAVEREVKALGGTIKVYSELYRGTRFDIRLPNSLDLVEEELARSE
ncbi:MAG: ATP-binding protein [Bdellovibrionales bacterium]